MSVNMIACYFFMAVGMLLVIVALVNGFKMFKNDGEEYRIIPAMLSAIGGLLIIVSAVHWNDDKEFKTIDCKEYRIERIIITYSENADTTYRIYYK